MAAPDVAREQLRRLFQILIALRTRRPPNADALAEHCEVSRRTIYRDLSLLGQVGVPVRYDPDQRGYVLAPEFRFDVPRLEPTEAEALAVVVQSCDDLGAFGLLGPARRGLSRLLAGLPTADRERLLELMERINTTTPTVELSLSQRAAHEAILTALVRQRIVHLNYRNDASRSALELTTRLSPYRLIRASHFWTVEGRSSRHQSIHAFPTARIVRAELTDESFIIPARDQDHIAATAQKRRGWRQVRLRCPHECAEPLVTQLPGPIVCQTVDALGRVEIEMNAASLENVLMFVLARGEDVEVLDPPELRAEVVARARRVVQNHVSFPLLAEQDEAQRA